LFSSAARPAGEQQLGRILYSQAASLRGLPVPTSETLFNGDALATSENGSALIELKSGARLRIRENSSVRFLGDGDRVQAELLAGAVESESAGKPTLVVTTSKFQFTPSRVEDCRFTVALSKQQETVAAAFKGDLLVRTPDAQGSYILPEGKYAAIPASSEGVPAQAKAGGAPASADQAGTIITVIPQALEQQGKGAEVALKAGAGINAGAVVRTLNAGRVRIALPDGSTLNVGALSVMSITKQDPVSQQTQVKLSQGLMRADAVKLGKPGANFKVQTTTATIGVDGSGVIVQALENITQVFCIDGACSVQNVDPTVAGQVTLHAGESTTVPGGLPPTPPVQIPPDQLETQISQTTVGFPPPAATAGGGAGGKTPWHIGSLSPGASTLVLVGIGGGVAAAAGIAASGGHGASAPASPSAP
jgi:ferric-dicitrate binding protein FerR (iron transport regulator)